MKSKLIFFLVLNICLFGVVNNLLAQNPEAKLGWKLGAQAYTFNRFTFFEAIDKIDSCGLKYVEAYPGQTIGGGIEGKMDYHMDAAKRTKILQRLKEKGILLFPTAFFYGEGNKLLYHKMERIDSVEWFPMA